MLKLHKYVSAISSYDSFQLTKEDVQTLLACVMQARVLAETTTELILWYEVIRMQNIFLFFVFIANFDNLDQWGSKAFQNVLVFPPGSGIGTHKVLVFPPGSGIDSTFSLVRAYESPSDSTSNTGILDSSPALKIKQHSKRKRLKVAKEVEQLDRRPTKHMPIPAKGTNDLILHMLIMHITDMKTSILSRSQLEENENLASQDIGDGHDNVKMCHEKKDIEILADDDGIRSKNHVE
nr:hypothetical protein [Tanacetum cinerariifolium]